MPVSTLSKSRSPEFLSQPFSPPSWSVWVVFQGSKFLQKWALQSIWSSCLVAFFAPWSWPLLLWPTSKSVRRSIFGQSESRTREYFSAPLQEVWRRIQPRRPLFLFRDYLRRRRRTMVGCTAGHNSPLQSFNLGYSDVIIFGDVDR